MFEDGADNCLVRQPTSIDNVTHKLCYLNSVTKISLDQNIESYHVDWHRFINWHLFDQKQYTQCMLSLPYDIVANEFYTGVTFPIDKRQVLYS